MITAQVLNTYIQLGHMTGHTIGEPQVIEACNHDVDISV